MADLNNYPKTNVVLGKNYVYDVGLLSWVVMTQPSGSSGGGDASAANQALEIAALGATTDVEAAGNGSIIALLKRIRTLLGSSLAVTGTFWQATQPVSGPLTDTQLRATAVPVSGTFFQVTQPISIAATVATKEVRAATPTQSTVADTASSTTLLASNANRLGATIFNDSSAPLYLKLGATASTTSYTAKVVSGAYYEVPYGYTGIIDGIWASDPNDGAARISELAA